MEILCRNYQIEIGTSWRINTNRTVTMIANWWSQEQKTNWALFQYKDSLPRYGDSHDKIRQSWYLLIIITRIPILFASLCWDDPLNLSMHGHMLFCMSLVVQGPLSLTRGGVTHICVSKLTIIGSDNGMSPGQWRVPSYYLNQYWNIVNWEQTSVKSLLKFYIPIQENALENVVWIMWTIFPWSQCVNWY